MTRNGFLLAILVRVTKVWHTGALAWVTDPKGYNPVSPKGQHPLRSQLQLDTALTPANALRPSQHRSYPTALGSLHTYAVQQFTVKSLPCFVSEHHRDGEEF